MMHFSDVTGVYLAACLKKLDIARGVDSQAPLSKFHDQETSSGSKIYICICLRNKVLTSHRSAIHQNIDTY